jgi:hypothetical protein
MKPFLPSRIPINRHAHPWALPVFALQANHITFTGGLFIGILDGRNSFSGKTLECN